ncbi:MAG: hypothetical protein ACK5LX_02815 [Oscillospiraceae bacterium]
MDTMTHFWLAYAEVVYAYYYWDGYKTKIANRDIHISFFIAVVTSAGVAAWGFWNQVDWLWAIIAIAAQLVGIAYPYMKYSVKEFALNLAVPEIERIKIEMERDYIFMDETPDETISEATYKYQERFLNVCHKYLESLNFSHDKKLQDKATKLRGQYIQTKFSDSGYTKEESCNE